MKKGNTILCDINQANGDDKAHKFDGSSFGSRQFKTGWPKVFWKFLSGFLNFFQVFESTSFFDHFQY